MDTHFSIRFMCMVSYKERLSRNGTLEVSQRQCFRFGDRGEWHTRVKKKRGEPRAARRGYTTTRTCHSQ
jgi:hypothetical protein